MPDAARSTPVALSCAVIDRALGDYMSPSGPFKIGRGDTGLLFVETGDSKRREFPATASLADVTDTLAAMLEGWE